MSFSARSASAAVIVFSAVFGFGGCDRPGGVDESVPPDGRTSASDTLFLEATRVVGLLDGEPEYLFGSVAAVAGDAEGRIYVGDRNGGTIRVFDEDGGFLRWIAREGQGPGEINGFAAHLLVGEGGELYVRDGSRVTVFGRRQGGTVPDSVVALWRPPAGGNQTSARSYLARDGRYFYPGARFLPGEVPRYFYASFLGGELTGDTLDVPNHPGLDRIRRALFPLGGDALMLSGVNHVPFSPIPVWDATPAGTLLSTDGASSVLLETDASGDTLRAIALPETPRRPVAREEAADSVAALEGRIAEAEELVGRFGGSLSEAAGIGEGVLETELPDSVPSVIGLAVTGRGSIWVERWPPEGDPGARLFDVLDWNGSPRYVVVVRTPLVRDPPAWFGERFIVGIVRDSETGVERIARFDLP